jgi:hypothetical protein
MNMTLQLLRAQGRCDRVGNRTEADLVHRLADSGHHVVHLGVERGHGRGCVGTGQFREVFDSQDLRDLNQH